MITIEQAVELAFKAHKGQKDLEGKPEIMHPMIVGMQGRNLQEKIAGILHDVVEDSSYTLDDLRSLGVDDEVLDALALLTHDKSKMTYEEYVKNIAKSGDKIAIAVKMHDLKHNISRGKANNHTRLVEKHTKAWKFLLPYYMTTK